MSRRGSSDSFDDFADEAPLLAHSYATSIAGQSALERPFAPIRRGGHAEHAGRPRTAHGLAARNEGFDLHAGLRIAAQHASARDSLERLMRYSARPRILGHLRIPTEAPALIPARASPTADLWRNEVA